MWTLNVFSVLVFVILQIFGSCYYITGGCYVIGYLLRHCLLASILLDILEKNSPIRRLLSLLLTTLELSSELVGRLQVRDQLRTEQDAMLLEIQDLTSLWSSNGPCNDVYIHLFFLFFFFKLVGAKIQPMQGNQNWVLGGNKEHHGGVTPGLVSGYMYI